MPTPSSTSNQLDHLLLGLERYAQRWPAEAATVERFSEFVRSEASCFERSLLVGHVTGSAWVVDGSGERVLLTHHRKLNCWLQLGGHADGDPNVLAVALREAREESGLDGLSPVTPEIFDVDIHRIPEKGGVPTHFHYDLRYAIRATENERYVVSEESHDLAWVAVDRIHEYTTEASMLRMAAKWQGLKTEWR